MAGKAKHSYNIRQKPTNEWEILAVDAEGNQFFYGNFTMKQNAVRWGDSHKIPNRYPMVVEVDQDEFGINATPIQSAPADPVDRSIYTLCVSAGVNCSDRADVADFLGLPPEILQQVTDPTSGELVFQPPR